jgi:outer membrane receptor protein involved in Fe transport
MKLSNISLAVSAILLGASSSVWAEEQKLSEVEKRSTEQQQTKEEKVIEKVTVTGSRLKRDSFSVATPLTIMNKEAIEDTGLGSLAEIMIEELPSITEATSNSNSQSNVTATGLSTINLRELGSERTLMLVDGRRVVSNSHSGNYVSLSTIPSGMVERVEVITGGASAAYGSDAIAGVVNIITQQDKEGFSIDARHGESTEGGAREFTLDLDYGTEFADGKGYVFASTTFDKQYGLTFDDRERAQQEAYFSYSGSMMCNTVQTAEGYLCLRDTDKSQWTSKSDSIRGGVFDEKSSSRPDAGFWYDENGLRDDWHEERYGINTREFVMLKVPDEALSAAVKVDYELDNGMETYFQVQFSRNTSLNNKAPESEDESDLVDVFNPDTGEFTRVDIGRIPRDNPYVPEEIREQASSKGIKWDRGFYEVGNIFTDNTRETLRTWGGIRGTVFNDEWDWDLSVGYGKFTQEQIRGNEISTINARYALDAEYAEDGVTIQCADADARANGCVPLNLFGEGSITPEAADYIRVNPTINSEVEQFTVLGYMTGDLFELPAGNVATAVGFEYREDSQSLEVGGGAENGGVTFNYVPSYSGSIDVKEVFGEASIPLLKNVTGAEYLSAEVSARFADYSWATSGLVESYKLGLMWEVVKGYSLRANWATAQRAPAIDDLMSPMAADYDSFDDICGGVTATSDKPGHDACRQEEGIANWLATNPGEELPDYASSFSPSIGNMDLKEESAVTQTLGFTINPSFLPELFVAVDYYHIETEDAIASYDNEQILEFCYNSDLGFGDHNPFCNAIERDEDGQVLRVDQKVYNIDELATSGYDVAIQYRYDMGEYGSLSFKADMTHIIDYTKTVTNADGSKETTDYTKDLEVGLFEDTASLSLTWRMDEWRIRWSTKYKSDVFLDRQAYQNDYADWLDDMADNDEECTAGSEDCIANPEPLADHIYKIPSYTKHNLSVSYTTELDNDSRLRIYGGLNNVFDDRGEFIFGGRGNYDSEYGGGVGRFYYLGAEVSF